MIIKCGSSFKINLFFEFFIFAKFYKVFFLIKKSIVSRAPTVFLRCTPILSKALEIII